MKLLDRVPILSIWFTLGGALLMGASLLAQSGPAGKPEPAPQQTQKLTTSAIQFERIVPRRGPADPGGYACFDV